MSSSSTMTSEIVWAYVNSADGFLSARVSFHEHTQKCLLLVYLHYFLICSAYLCLQWQFPAGEALSITSLLQRRLWSWLSVAGTDPGAELLLHFAWPCPATVPTAAIWPGPNVTRGICAVIYSQRKHTPKKSHRPRDQQTRAWS